MHFVTIGIPGQSSSFLEFESKSLELTTFSCALLGAIGVSRLTTRDEIFNWLKHPELCGTFRTVSIAGRTHRILNDDCSFLDESLIRAVIQTLIERFH